MGSLYHNQQILGRIQEMGVLDRFVRLPHGTCEQIVSLVIVTSPEGLVAAAITIDLVAANGVGVMSTLIAQYPMTHQDHAMMDARLMADRFGLAVRGSTTTVGWSDVQVAHGDVIRSAPEVDFTV